MFMPRRDISGELAVQTRTTAFEISPFKQDFIKRNYPITSFSASELEHEQVASRNNGTVVGRLPVDNKNGE